MLEKKFKFKWLAVAKPLHEGLVEQTVVKIESTKASVLQASRATDSKLLEHPDQCLMWCRSSDTIVCIGWIAQMCLAECWDSCFQVNVFLSTLSPSPEKLNLNKWLQRTSNYLQASARSFHRHFGSWTCQLNTAMLPKMLHKLHDIG